MITDEKKKRIESLSDEEMSYEINLGCRSLFQRESFAYLQTCYQKRKDEKEEHDAMMRAFLKVPLAHELEVMPDVELAELQSQLPHDSPGKIIVESEWGRRKSSKPPKTKTIPDFEWYGGISKEKGMTSRCPFATVEVCPRYYQSLSLLPEAGFTGIPDKENAKFLKKWKSSDLWPKIDEQATSVSKSDSRLSTLSNFCPEVLYDSFGYFCTFLSSYADEIDSDMAHRILHKQGAASNDPRWRWSSSIPQHYSECPLFSVIEHRSKTQRPNITAIGNDLHILASSQLKPLKGRKLSEIANIETTSDNLYIQPNWAKSEDSEVPPIKKETIMKIFVSHSSVDKSVAEAFVELVRAALNLSSKDIRCTSVAGYKLPVGADSNEQLRTEVFGCELFIALLSPTSMKSVYVMFELGARWGTKRHLAPIMISGTQPSDLKAPLSGINSIDGTSESDLHQLLAEMGAELSLPLEGAASYNKALRALVKAAKVVTKSQNDNKELRSKIQEYEQPAEQSTHNNLLDNDKLEILKLLFKQADLRTEQVAQALNLQLPVAKYHLGELKKLKFVRDSYPRTRLMEVVTAWAITNEGTGYLLENGLAT